MLIQLSEVCEQASTDEGLRGWHACDEAGGALDLWYRLSYDPAYSPEEVLEDGLRSTYQKASSPTS